MYYLIIITRTYLVELVESRWIYNVFTFLKLNNFYFLFDISFKKSTKFWSGWWACYLVMNENVVYLHVKNISLQFDEFDKRDCTKGQWNIAKIKWRAKIVMCL